LQNERVVDEAEVARIVNRAEIGSYRPGLRFCDSLV
jgi:hypothetical protein